MKRLRTISWFIRVLVGLFLAAQFAGVVSSPHARAMPAASVHLYQNDAYMGRASRDNDLDGHGHAGHQQAHDQTPGHHHDNGGLDTACCGLHACFAGILPPLAAVGAACAMGKPIAAVADDLTLGFSGGRLDRPPRPQRRS